MSSVLLQRKKEIKKHLMLLKSQPFLLGFVTLVCSFGNMYILGVFYSINNPYICQ